MTSSSLRMLSLSVCAPFIPALGAQEATVLRLVPGHIQARAILAQLNG